MRTEKREKSTGFIVSVTALASAGLIFVALLLACIVQAVRLVTVSPEPTAQLWDECRVEVTEYSSRKVYTISPMEDVSDLTVLYFHGGSYKYTFYQAHWRFLRYLIEETGCTVVTPDYPTVPEHTYRDVFEMVVPLYLDTAEKYSPENIVLMGDSSGGGLALALAEEMTRIGGQQPAELVLLSPWLDVSMTNPDMKKRDFMLNYDKLKQAGELYAGGDGVTNQKVSPIYGDFSQLAPITVFTCTGDMLNADARRFRELAREQNVSLDFRETPGTFHVWMLVDGLPLAKPGRVRREIAEVLSKRIELIAKQSAEGMLPRHFLFSRKKA